LTKRARLIEYFDEAGAAGAPRYKVAQLMALSERTIKRWRERDRVAADRCPDTQPALQPHQLTPEEEQAMLDICNLSEFRSLPPSQIVPALADKGIYIASESWFYRVLKKHRQLSHRGRGQPPSQVPEPTSFTATGPNQAYSWDISYCPSNVKGLFWYLYLILDVYSRKIVA